MSAFASWVCSGLAKRASLMVATSESGLGLNDEDMESERDCSGLGLGDCDMRSSCCIASAKRKCTSTVVSQRSEGCEGGKGACPQQRGASGVQLTQFPLELVDRLLVAASGGGCDCDVAAVVAFVPAFLTSLARGPSPIAFHLKHAQSPSASATASELNSASGVLTLLSLQLRQLLEVD